MAWGGEFRRAPFRIPVRIRLEAQGPGLTVVTFLGGRVLSGFWRVEGFRGSVKV